MRQVRMHRQQVRMQQRLVRKRQQQVRVQELKRLVQALGLLLSCRKQPGQQRQRWLPKRETCSFLRSLMIFKKQFPEIVKRNPNRDSSCFDRGKDSSSFYPALNYMLDIASPETLSRQSKTV